MERSHPQPLESLSPKQLLANLKAEVTGEPDPAQSPEAEDNRRTAAAELSAISELKGSVAFQWFERTFIDEPFVEARRRYHDPAEAVESLPTLRTKYLTLRALKAAILEREIAHRELITPLDEEIPRLRERLGLL